MQKLITTIIFISLFTAAHAQKITEAEARQYLEKVWGYLKTSDSVAFVKLWLPEDSMWQKQHTPPGGVNYMESYLRLKKFLRPAENLNMDRIEIGQESANGTEIKAYFRARERAMIGFSFYVSRVNGQWTARGRPGYFAK